MKKPTRQNDQTGEHSRRMVENDGQDGEDSRRMEGQRSVDSRRMHVQDVQEGEHSRGMDGQMDEHDGNQPSRSTLSGQDGEQSKEMEESRIKI